jgi:hypothetical protein
MSGVVFLIELAAFAVVIHWAFERRGPDGPGADTGLLAMRRVDDNPAPPQSRSDRILPRWKRSALRPPPPRA